MSARAGLAAASIIVGIWGAAPAAAAPRCRADGPWVLVQLRADGWTAEQRARVIEDLGQALAPQAIGACVCGERPSQGAPPLATLTIAVDAARGGAGATIEVRDEVTGKRLDRDVDLARIPADGRAAAVAIEADELLRASWAELALDTFAQGAPPPP